MKAIKTRHVLAFMCFLGMMNVNLLKVNLNLAIVTMARNKPAHEDTNQTGGRIHSENSSNEKITSNKNEFDWNSVDRGNILGSYFYGFAVSSLFGGRLSEHYGGVRVFGLGVLITSVITMFTPLAARSSKVAVIIVRVLEGLSEGVVFPSLHTICSKWIPTKERGFTYGTIFSGTEFGAIIGFPITAGLVNSGFLGGWPACFYIFGCFGIVWYAFWWLSIFESPAHHTRISLTERDYILKNINLKAKHKVKVPWLKLLTSVPLWSAIIASFLSFWSLNFIITELPTFLDSMLHFNIQTNGLLSSIPHIANMMVKSFTGLVTDLTLKRSFLNPTAVRKTIHLICTFISAMSFVGVCLAKHDKVIVMVCLVLGAGFQGSTVGVVIVALFDVAPDFAGTMMGILIAISSIPGFIVPALVGALTKKEDALIQWHKCIYIIAGVTFLGGLLYALFGSSELQSWAKSEDDQTLETAQVPGTTSASNCYLEKTLTVNTISECAM